MRQQFYPVGKLSEVEINFEDVVDLMVKGQFINSCSRKLSVYLIERKPPLLRKLAAIAQ